MTQIQLQQELNEIKKLVKETHLNSKEVFNSAELNQYLGWSESTLYKLTRFKLIPTHQPTKGLLFFFKEEILEWIKTYRIDTEDDANNLLKNHKKTKKA